jgi:hypothetical protein
MANIVLTDPGRFNLSEAVGACFPHDWRKIDIRRGTKDETAVIPIGIVRSIFRVARFARNNKHYVLGESLFSVAFAVIVITTANSFVCLSKCQLVFGFEF